MGGFSAHEVDDKERLIGLCLGDDTPAVAQCETAIGEIMAVDSCLAVELRRPRFSIGESRSSLFER
jgi:hypothetical protein